MDQINLGLQLMGYGLAGVFLVLILFYAVIRLLVKIFPYNPEEEQD
ncbi:MAG: hypothetical protein PWR27_1297 [Petroclostridium sp.]|jgi:Na+-transporting methylmalonyl-CoA/oxaloacetate decarboxylase gamma subunit|nr:OadG family protein [Petroclostridium xylanilyticum]MBZ4646339.1 hypothetical protein [Clostridia bacterium]MDK2810588.1 hypothetical protein [Petroclostridium sp.]